MSSFNFRIYIVLNPSSNSTFLNNYFAFLAAIANAANTDFSSLFLVSVIYGPVSINITVSSSATPGSDEAIIQQQNL